MNRFMNKRKTAPTQGSWSAPTDNLLAYYTMDDGALETDITLGDKSGNGHDLTCVNDPVAAGADVWTDEAGAISFDDGENTDYFVSEVSSDFACCTEGRRILIFTRTKVLSSGHDATTGLFGMGDTGAAATDSAIDAFQLNNGLHRTRYKINGSSATNQSAVAGLADDTWHSYAVMVDPGVYLHTSVDGAGYVATDVSSKGVDTIAAPKFWIASQFGNFTNPAEAMRIGRTEIYVVDSYLPNFRNLAIWKAAHPNSLIPKALLP